STWRALSTGGIGHRSSVLTEVGLCQYMNIMPAPTTALLPAFQQRLQLSIARLDIHRIHTSGMYLNQQIHGADHGDGSVRHLDQVIAAVTGDKCGLHAAPCFRRQVSVLTLRAHRPFVDRPLSRSSLLT